MVCLAFSHLPSCQCVWKLEWSVPTLWLKQQAQDCSGWQGTVAFVVSFDKDVEHPPHPSVVCSVVFSANPVKPSATCMAQADW